MFDVINLCINYIDLCIDVLIALKQMHSYRTSSSFLLATFISIYILTISLLSTSLALPASPSDLISNIHYQHIIKTRSAARKYCGNNIINVLRLLCDGNYFSPSKRNSINPDSKRNNGIHSTVCSIA